MPEPTLDLKTLNVKKLPVWVWVAAGGGAIVLVYVILRNNATTAVDTPAPNAGGGGTSDALAAVSGFTQQLDQIRTGIQAQIAALTSDQQAALQTITDSINTSIEAITARIATLTTGQAEIRAALSGALSQISSLASEVTGRGADAALKVQQYNAIIQELRDQITALTANNPVTAATIATAFDTARQLMARIDQGLNYVNSPWYRASDDAIQANLRANQGVLAGNPARALILAAVRNSAGQWTLSGSTTNWLPLPVVWNKIPPSGT